MGGGIEYGQNATALAWLNRLGQNARCGAPEDVRTLRTWIGVG
jgi:hypothetical protein